jgi:hypothetical protein
MDHPVAFGAGICCANRVGKDDLDYSARTAECRLQPDAYLSGVFVAGLFCCCGLVLWTIATVVYVMVKRKRISTLDFVMAALSLLATVALVIPDTFFD